MASIEPTTTEKPRCRAGGCARLARTDGLCALHKWEVDQGLLILAAEEPQCLVEDAGKVKGRRNRQGPVPPDVATAFAADYAIAKNVNGTTPPGSPMHEVNRRFNAKLAELASAGHTYAQIAEAAGASVHMVNRRLTKIRHDKPRRGSPDPKLPITEEMHGTGTGYRYGCRCAKCRLRHSKEHQKRRWALRYGPGGPMGPEVRERIIEALRRSGSLDDVVVEVQVKHQAIYSAARAVPDFGALLNQLTAGWPAGRNK